MNNEEDIMKSFQMIWWKSLSLDDQQKWLEIFSENTKINFEVKKKPSKEISPKTKEDIERWKQGNIDMRDKFDEFEYSEGC